MDHNEERKKNDHWNHCQHNIVNYLIDVWKLDIIGLIEVNAFEIKVFAEKENNNDTSVELGQMKYMHRVSQKKLPLTLPFTGSKMSGLSRGGTNFEDKL